MEQLILRQAAIDALRTCYDTETITMDNGNEYINYGDAVGEIEQLPTIQPKTGKWVDTGSNEEWYAREYRCSECGDTMLGEANFCPNCGAKMEVTE